MKCFHSEFIDRNESTNIKRFWNIIWWFWTDPLQNPIRDKFVMRSFNVSVFRLHQWVGYGFCQILNVAIVEMLLEGFVYCDIQWLENWSHFRWDDFEKDSIFRISLRDAFFQEFQMNRIWVENDKTWFIASWSYFREETFVDKIFENLQAPHSSFVYVSDTTIVDLRNFYKFREKQMCQNKFATRWYNRCERESFMRRFSHLDIFWSLFCVRVTALHVEIARNLIEIEDVFPFDVMFVNSLLYFCDIVSSD